MNIDAKLMKLKWLTFAVTFSRKRVLMALTFKNVISELVRRKTALFHWLLQ